jgi:ABC-2 type transport system ATP-binding protein
VTTKGSSRSATISMRGVTRRFNGLTAVDDVTLDVPEGTILGLIGPSGSGKTTTVRMLTGTLAPTAGEIQVLGEEPRRFSRRVREQIAYMPQLFSLYPDLTARENVGFVAALYGIGLFTRRKRIKRALEMVDLWQARDRLARELSGGEQRRLELACALVHSASVLFVDEPTAGVDPMLRQTIWDELRDLRHAGNTLLVTTQYVGEAEYCDRVALLDHGALVALDEPAALRRSVFGGEVVEVVTDRAADPEMLTAAPAVASVRQTEARKLVVVADDAGRAAPEIVNALSRQGIGVVSVDEYQPSFDEVFAGLVERHRNGRREAAGADRPR